MNARKKFDFDAFGAGFVFALVLVFVAWGCWSIIVGAAHFACAVIAS
jgi:hypothetical protein